MRTGLIKRKILNSGALWLSKIKLVPSLFRLNKNSVVIDCGANVGHITSLLARTGATVYAFEPDPVAFELLQRRVKNKKNVIIIKKGVWDRNTVLSLFRHIDTRNNEAAFTVGSSIIQDKINVDTARTEQIEVIDLVEFIQSLGKRISLIKLDVEGAETEILKKILQTKTYTLFDMMYVETHETKIPGQKILLNAIKKEMVAQGVTNIKLNWL